MRNIFKLEHEAPQWTHPAHDDRASGGFAHLLSHSVYPNRIMYQAMRNDHSETPITAPIVPNGQYAEEEQAENLVIKHCLNVNKIHWGILEHPHLTLGLFGFPRWAILQLRTHRNSTWDVQSMRETGNKIAEDGAEIERRWYQPGLWNSLRQLFDDEYFWMWHADQAEDVVHKHFAIEWFHIRTEASRQEVVCRLAEQMVSYSRMFTQPDFKKERARGIIGDSVRCNAYVTLNLRHLLHLGSVRLAGNAQDATSFIVWQMLQEAKKAHPNIIDWFMEQHPERLTLSP